MLTVICDSKFESLLLALGAKIIEGKWSLTQLSDADKEILEASGATVEGCKYKCWDSWYPNIYWVSRDPRCSVSFNTLAKRAAGLVTLDSVVVGRAKAPRPTRRRGQRVGYRVNFQDKDYPSETAIAREFGINPVKFRSRRQLGWSIVEALDKS